MDVWQLDACSTIVCVHYWSLLGLLYKEGILVILMFSLLGCVKLLICGVILG